MAPQVEYRQLGRSGLRVSVPILGGMAFGSSQWLPWVIDEDKGLPLLKAAWDCGINTIDTANVYSNGESEKMIAKFIQQNNIPRENMVILTKIKFLVGSEASMFTFAMPHLPNTRDYVNLGGLSRTAIMNQVDASLQRLNTSYIDLLQIHDFDPEIPLEETMKALHDLVVSGKVRYIGACRLRLWQFAEMNSVAERNGWTTFSSMQVEHSLLYRPEELEVIQYCKLKGIGVIGFSPLMDGHLARPIGTETTRTKMINGTPYEKKRRPCDLEIIKRVQELAAKHSWTMSQVALAWSVTKISSPIVGANTGERVEQCIITGKTLTSEELKYLEESYEYQPYR
ncbi:Aldo/keto reductase [Laetiporus sulphureus 93-53]|uniref:Aldo/keto reductase n=1 Tax=Laetiporus sulphureus 93-53 TaxID=1314785 RepID=A0A165G2F7_9APHY|nr:Aldo/keto reductase [Laetiporus sulphureus 93-53]KZT09739.1 Aldo/keto reductase [Laetiporus sulphureus 93-53]